MKDGISDALGSFLKDPKWLSNNIVYEAWADKISNEWMKLPEFSCFYAVMRYLKYRIIS